MTIISPVPGFVLGAIALSYNPDIPTGLRCWQRNFCFFLKSHWDDMIIATGQNLKQNPVGMTFSFRNSIKLKFPLKFNLENIAKHHAFWFMTTVLFIFLKTMHLFRNDI